MPFRNNENTSFIDIISNLLGIVIIITLLLAIAKTAVLEIEDKKENILNIISKQWNLFTPQEIYYLVFDQYIIEINFNDLAENILKEQEATLLTEQGSIKRFKLFLFEEVHRRDPISYILEFTPDLEKLKQAYTSIDNAHLSDFFTKQFFNQTNTIPTFIVLESGLPLFAELYLLIKQHQLHHRWFAWSKDLRTQQYHITFSYEHGNFSRRDIRR